MTRERGWQGDTCMILPDDTAGATTIVIVDRPVHCVIFY